jgi:hypothetical protein
MSDEKDKPTPRDNVVNFVNSLNCDDDEPEDCDYYGDGWDHDDPVDSEYETYLAEAHKLHRQVTLLLLKELHERVSEHPDVLTGCEGLVDLLHELGKVCVD